jgi:hypothetical protein
MLAMISFWTGSVIWDSYYLEFEEVDDPLDQQKEGGVIESATMHRLHKDNRSFSQEYRFGGPS